VRLLTNDPVPLPFVVCEFAIVGVPVVFQQTPRPVTVAPPSAVTFPPLDAVVDVIDEMDVVVTVGAEAKGSQSALK
jgi:hypothetical protein